MRLKKSDEYPGETNGRREKKGKEVKKKNRWNGDEDQKKREGRKQINMAGMKRKSIT